MAKGDYPTGALVEILRYYKDNADRETYNQARDELISLTKFLIKLEAVQVQRDQLIEFIKEVAKPPYFESDPASLLETIQGRAQKILAAMEDKDEHT